MAQEQYYFGQGRVSIREYGSSSKAWRWMGDVSELTLSSTEEKLEHKENYSGFKKKVRSISFGGDVSLSATLFQLDKHNLAMATRGTITDVPAATVTDENLGTVAVGDIFILDEGYNVDNVQIEGASGNILDPQYYDLDARTGRIEILGFPAAPLVQPLSVSYQHQGASGVVMFNQTVKDMELRYEGINLAEEGAPVILELYRISPGNLQNLSFISADTSSLASMPWTADVLNDSSKPSNGALGQLGRFLQINEG